jgi:SAM-dependent MidA family methyltransferase
VVGCVLSNELLDAFPVHRFQVHDGSIREVFVTLEGDGFAETLDEPSTPEIARRVDEAVEAPLPEGFRGEVCLLIDPWVGQVAAALQRGFVLTVDYGDTAQCLYSLRRSRGTLQCYYRHTVSADPYVRVGRQDITAHVDFGAVMEAGRRCGLADIGYTSQGEFLANLGAHAFTQALEHQARQGALPQRAVLANRMAMTELLRPKGLGGFRVLAQGKGVGSPRLWGFDPDNPKRRDLEKRATTLEAPLLSDAETPLLEGRYPHQAWDPGALWPWAEEGSQPLDGGSAQERP